jgi:hypothetical protein
VLVFIEEIWLFINSKRVGFPVLILLLTKFAGIKNPFKKPKQIVTG